jgi:MraZ protein
MALFLGSFLNKVDKKGRVSVPAPFRAALAPASGFIALPSIFDFPCVEAWDQERVEQLSVAIDRLPLFSPERQALTNTIFHESCELAFDPEGRIALTAELMAQAGLTESALFVGRGPTFEIWEPARFEPFKAAARKQLRENPPAITLRRDGDKP